MKVIESATVKKPGNDVHDRIFHATFEKEDDTLD